MYRWMRSVFLGLALVGLVGCGGGGGTPSSADQNSTDNNTTVEQNSTLTAEEIAQLVEKAYGIDQSGLAGEEAMVHLITHVPLKRGVTRVADEQSADMFGGDYQAYWDGEKMIKGEVPIEYFYESGRRGTIKANTGIPNHWDYYQINYPDVGPDYNVTYLNFGSDGLYDVTVWNINIQPDGWVRYNTMAQFQLYERDNRHLFHFGSIYNEDWDGSENDRSIYGLYAYLWVSGKNESNPNLAGGDPIVHKTFIQEYTMHDGTVLDNCLVGQFTLDTRGLREDNEEGGIRSTVVIHLGNDHGLTGEVLKYFKETKQHGHGVMKVFIETVEL